MQEKRSVVMWWQDRQKMKNCILHDNNCQQFIMQIIYNSLARRKINSMNERMSMNEIKEFLFNDNYMVIAIAIMRKKGRLIDGWMDTIW